MSTKRDEVFEIIVKPSGWLAPDPSITPFSYLVTNTILLASSVSLSGGPHAVSHKDFALSRLQPQLWEKVCH